MRIKSYTAANVAKAMDMVRLELGDDAIILSTQNETGGGTTVTAAIEQSEPELPKMQNGAWAADWDADWKKPGTVKPAPGKVVNGARTKPAASAPRSAARGKKPAPIKLTEKLKTLVQALAYHGVPTKLGEQLCRLAAKAPTEDSDMAMATAFDQHFRFSTAPLRARKPVMLIGPPGVGKTMTIAKMAAAAKLAKQNLSVITTDGARAGAVDQLKSFTDILEIPLLVARDAKTLGEQLATLSVGKDHQVLIDTGGINPYNDAQIADLTALILAAEAIPLVVLAAGTDSAEMSDTAKTFAAIGANHLLVTRLDTTRRYGGILTAASNAGLGFTYASVSPAAAAGLHTLTPVNLARLILRDPQQSGVRNEFDKASS